MSASNCSICGFRIRSQSEIPDGYHRACKENVEKLTAKDLAALLPWLNPGMFSNKSPELRMGGS